MRHVVCLAALLAATPALAAQIEPYPVNLGPGVGLKELQFSEERIAEIRNFNNTAAGSFHPTDEHLRGEGLAKAVGALAVGASLDFNANTNTGTITVLDDEAVGKWSCKQVRWTIQRKKKSAERLGLFCRDQGNWSKIW